MNHKEIRALQKALQKAYDEPRGFFYSYLSCLREQDRRSLKSLWEKDIPLKKFADKIRKGEYEIKVEYKIIIK